MSLMLRFERTCILLLEFQARTFYYSQSDGIRDSKIEITVVISNGDVIMNDYSLRATAKVIAFQST